jgi:hypothetical protein
LGITRRTEEEDTEISEIGEELKDNRSSQRWRKAMKRKSTPSPAYVYKSATHGRMRAEEMRALAEEARDPMVRLMMLAIAADYGSFAESADDGAIGC